MKRTILLLIVLTIFHITGFSQVFVATDKSLQTDFSELETYTWSSHAKNDDLNYSLNDAILKSTIRDAIAYELDARGYRQVESVDDADFLVNFRTFDGKGDFQGYVGIYKDENYWSPNELKMDMIGLTPEEEIRDRGDIRYYKFKEGTVLIDFSSTDKFARIWTGYASGVEDKYILDGDDDRIKDAIQKIFEEYEFKAGEGAQ